MPQIQDYGLPETEAQGPVGGISPNLEAVSELGRGVQRVGGALDQASDVFHRRQAQQEVSQTYATFSRLRNQYNQQIADDTANGTIDSEKIKQQYADAVNSYSDSVSTAEGKDYFNKQAARLGGTILTNSARGQAKVAGAQATDDLQNGLTADSNTLENDPHQFEDIHGKTQETIDANVSVGAIPATMAGKLSRQMTEKLAEAAVRGWAKKDVGADENGNPQENLAKQMLDKGAFDQFLNAAQKDQMYKYAHDQDNAKRIDFENNRRLAKDQQNDAAEKLMTDMLPSMANHTLTAQQVLNNRATLGFEKSDKLLNIIKANSKTSIETNDQVYTQLARGIVANDGEPGKVYSTDQILEHGGKDLSIPHMNQLVNEFNKTKSAKDLATSKSQLYKAAQSAIQYRDMSSPVTPQPLSMGGNTDYANFLKEAHQKENELIQQKVPMSDLYDPSSPNSLYKLIQKYQATPQERGRNTAHAMVQGAIQKSAAPKATPGENPADFLKRIGAGK